MLSKTEKKRLKFTKMKEGMSEADFDVYIKWLEERLNENHKKSATKEYYKEWKKERSQLSKREFDTKFKEDVEKSK